MSIDEYGLYHKLEEGPEPTPDNSPWNRLSRPVKVLAGILLAGAVTTPVINGVKEELDREAPIEELRQSIQAKLAPDPLSDRSDAGRAAMKALIEFRKATGSDVSLVVAVSPSMPGATTAFVSPATATWVSSNGDLEERPSFTRAQEAVDEVAANAKSYWTWFYQKDQAPVQALQALDKALPPATTIINDKLTASEDDDAGFISALKTVLPATYNTADGKSTPAHDRW